VFEGLLPLFPLVVPFLLVLTRVLGLFVFVPVFANSAIPGNVKVLLGVAITVCVWGVVPKRGVPADLISVVLAIAGEMSVGLLIGTLVALVFSGIQHGGQIISQQMGIGMASIYDPMFDQQSTVVEQITFWLTLSIFFAVGGHRELVGALVDSYHAVPMGQYVAPGLLLESALTAIHAAFQAAVRVAAPGLVAFFVATISMGFVGRSIPQINVMVVSLTSNILVGLVMILTGLSGWGMIARQSWHEMFDSLSRIFGH